MTVTVVASSPHSHHLCWSLVNKRVSWEQTTLCSARGDLSLSTTIQELPPGVYRLRSYLSTTSHDGRHWRGGHDLAEGLVVGSDAEVLFTVDKLAWQERARFDVISQQMPLPAIYPGLPRLAALELSRHLVEDPLLAETLEALNVDEKVIVMMCNGGHNDMATNALHSLRRVGVRNALVFGLSPDVCSESATLASYPCYSLPQTFLSKLCGDCTTRDVWSPGFADVAVIKPAVVLAALTLGYDVLWSDTDVVFLSDPFQNFRIPEVAANDIAIQAGGTLPYETVSWEMLFREELCTGFYLIKSAPHTVEFVRQTIVELR